MNKKNNNFLPKMFSNIIYLFVCIYVCSSVEIRTINKRNDIDLQTCIDNFDIHKDKIIRTQDSRDMGAKYLNEVDLGSREECLRLCCETETCDVFVYEEKNPGSCYLFHCGPPEDFKCKFTRHANYSSAVLAVNRHLNELENQIKLTKHEQDLTRLRKPEEIISNPKPALKVVPTPTSTTTQRSKEVVPAVPTKSPAGRRCSRYQFECRSSSECIAIYNACDGIPQCSDGSDEAPELSCPELGTTVAPSPQPPPLPVLPNTAYGQANQLRKPLPHIIPDNTYQPIGVPPNQRIPVDLHETPGFIRPGQEPRAPLQPYNDPGLIQGQPQQFVVARPPQNTWVQHPGAGIGQGSQYADKNSHIFQHKESGLQVMESPDSAAGIQYGDVNVHSDYQKVPNYYGDVYRQQYQPAENWQANPQSHGDNNPYVANDNWQQQYQQPIVNDQNSPVYHQNPEIPPNWKSDLLDKQAESKTFDHTVIHEPKDFEEPEKDHKNTDTEKPEKHHEIHKHSHILMAEELKQNIDDLQDGEAERPGGAILSLTLGVCLTCVMAILIGCRLRVVRRRMRRGGKSPYAHDADYLVNGMYL